MKSYEIEENACGKARALGPFWPESHRSSRERRVFRTWCLLRTVKSSRMRLSFDKNTTMI